MIQWSSHTYEKCSCLPFHSSLILVNNKCKSRTFWMAPWLICCFLVILFHIERKWLLVINIVNVLFLKSNLSRKFQRFSIHLFQYESIEMLKNVKFSKASKKWKILRYFTRSKLPASLRKCCIMLYCKMGDFFWYQKIWN